MHAQFAPNDRGEGRGLGTHAATRLLFRPAHSLGGVDLARLSCEIVSLMSKLVNGVIQGLARKVFGRGSDGGHAR